MLFFFSALHAFVAPASRVRTDGALAAASARSAAAHRLLSPRNSATLEVRTIQDGKDEFQEWWGQGFSGGWGDGTAPLPMSTTAFINEMITTVTIAMPSPNYQYSPIFALGFETLCSYYAIEVRNEAARERMREALAKALLLDPAQMKSDADALLAASEGADEEALLATAELQKLASLEGKFKYTYVFGTGLIILMQKVGVDPEAGVKSWCEKLNLAACEGQFARDYRYYKSQMDKLDGMKAMMAQMKEAAEKAAAKAAADTEAGVESTDPRKIANTQ